MKMVGYILGACLVLAIARAVAAALIVALLVAVVVGAFVKPRETFGVLLLLFGIGMVEAHPIICLVTLAAIVLLAILKHSLDESRS